MDKPRPRVPSPQQPEGEPDDTLETGFFETPPLPSKSKPVPGLASLIEDELAPKPGEAQWEVDDLGKTLPAEDMKTVYGEGAPAPAGKQPPSAAVKVLAVLAFATVAGGAALAYRSQHRKQVLAQGMTRAEALVRSDTYAGYREAERILEPLTQLDPLRAGSLRAFSLAMLALDYHDGAARQQADALLVVPDRSPEVPEYASAAKAALALSGVEPQAGTATQALKDTEAAPWPATLRARIALVAGNAAAAQEPLGAALQADATFPAALALEGDRLRREKKYEEARAAYARALEASPGHARAAYGMAKLALAGQVSATQALPPLERILADDAGTPAPERARAALHLSALRARVGDRAGAQAAIEKAGLDPASRAWLERAAAREELDRGGYHVVEGAPAAVQSASDDDPYVPPPPPAQVEPEKKPEVKAVAPSRAKKAAAMKKKAAQKKKAASKAAKKGKPKKKKSKKRSYSSSGG